MDGSFNSTKPQVAQGRPWYIQPSCAMTGDGLVEGLGACVWLWLDGIFTSSRTQQ